MKKRNIHVDYARWIFVLPALLSVGLLLPGQDRTLSKEQGSTDLQVLLL